VGRGSLFESIGGGSHVPLGHSMARKEMDQAVTVRQKRSDLNVHRSLVHASWRNSAITLIEREDASQSETSQADQAERFKIVR